MEKENAKGFKKIVSENELRTAFLDFVKEKKIADFNQDDLSLPGLLQYAKSEHELNEVLKVFFKNSTSVDFNSRALREVVKRKIELDRDPIPVRLDIYCELEISYVTVPDTQKDEIVLSAMLHTGVNTDNLREYLMYNQLCSAEEFGHYEENWQKVDIGIDMEEREKKLLEKVLCLEILEGYDKDIKYICYNFSESEVGPLLWRCCAFSTPVRIPLDFSEYPFDKHYLSFYLVSPDSFDVTDQYLFADDREDEEISSFLTDGMVAPRGLVLTSKSDSLLDVATLSRLDVWPESMIRFDLGFSRTSNTFLWHSYIPSAVISIFSLLGTGFAIFKQIDASHLVAVITTLLPTVLIAIAALQLVAVQNVPPNAGHTKQDDLFIIYYVSFLLNFISLQQINLFSKILFGVSSILVLSGLFYFAVKIIRYYERQKQ